MIVILTKVSHVGFRALIETQQLTIKFTYRTKRCALARIG